MRKWIWAWALSIVFSAEAAMVSCHRLLPDLAAIQEGLISGKFSPEQAAAQIQTIIDAQTAQERRLKIVDVTFFPVDISDEDSKLYVLRLELERPIRNRNGRFLVVDPRTYATGRAIEFILNSEEAYDAPTRYVFVEYWKKSEPDADEPFPTPLAFANFFRGKAFPLELEAVGSFVPLKVKRVFGAKEKFTTPKGHQSAQVVVEMEEEYVDHLTGFAWMRLFRGQEKQFLKMMVDRSTHDAPTVTIIFGKDDKEGIPGFVNLNEVPPTSVFKVDYFGPSVGMSLEDFMKQLEGKTLFLHPSYVRPFGQLANPFP